MKNEAEKNDNLCIVTTKEHRTCTVRLAGTPLISGKRYEMQRGRL